MAPQTEKDILTVAMDADSTQPTTEDQVPDEVSSAFNELFGEGEGGGVATATEAPPATRSKTTQGMSEEEAEELEGLETSEEDHGSLQDEDPEVQDEDDKPNDEGKATEDAGQASTLSPLLRQAAKRNGWPEDEIESFHKANPEQAEKTFNRLLESYNNLSAEYGRLGAAPASPEAPNHGMLPGVQPPATPAAPAQPNTGTTVAREVLQEVFGKEKLSVLKDKYDADFVEEALKPMAEAFVNRIEQVVSPLQQQVESYEQAQVRQTCFNFLDNVDPELTDVYGKGHDNVKLSEEQAKARGELFEEADSIRNGMMAKGIMPDLNECLERAHMLVAAKHMATIERKRLTASVKKRSQGITHRPSQRKKLRGPDQGSEADAMAAFDSAAREMGWD